MAKHSAGILLYRPAAAGYEVFLVHPGGPFWAKKDVGAWSMPKGEFLEGEDPLAAAKREFEEEVGAPPPDGNYQLLGEAKQPSGKIINAYAAQADFPAGPLSGATIQIDWPPKSGKKLDIPECDRAEWFPLAAAKDKLFKGQVIFIDLLAARLQTDVASVPGTPASPQQASLF